MNSLEQASIVNVCIKECIDFMDIPCIKDIKRFIVQLMHSKT